MGRRRKHRMVEAQVETIDLAPAAVRAPVVLRARTRDGRFRHLRALLVFSTDWRELDVADLTDEQLDAIRSDPLLEVEVIG